MTRFALLLLAAATAWSADKPERYRLEEGRFALTVPAGWKASRDAQRDARDRVQGVDLRGGQGRILVEFYGPGNALFETPQSYIRANSGVLYKDDKAPEVREKTLNGRKAWTFTVDRSYARKTNSLDPDFIELREEFWVVEAPGGGFHAVMLSAGRSDFKAGQKALKRLLKSLEFLPA